MTPRLSNSTLLRLGPARQPSRRLFCLPYAGGGVSAFGQWWRDLPPDIEVLGVQLPGREARLDEPPLTSIAAMADSAFAVISQANDLPYAIFGHSMGALVAFELTLRIEADGTLRPPGHLFLSGRRAPGSIEPVPDMLPLPDEQFLQALELRFGAVSDDVRNQPELIDLLLPVLRADVQAVEQYVAPAGRSVRCLVDVCGGDDDQHPTPAELHHWERWVEQPLGLHTFPGNHFYIAPSRQALLRWITQVWRN